ncbi:hypothetical protein [Actinoplanes sp. NPDC051851]|uniref:hypothetical protein n=1 Tax=Actinoplanes sp. NPDC051851 TaxID=3154753 RepID=UPI003449E11F
MPEVQASIPAAMAVTLLGFAFILVQPGAIPFAYAWAQRRVLRGRERVRGATVVGYLLGCLLTGAALGVLGLFSEMPFYASAVLAYLMMWLLALNLLRDGSTVAGAEPEAPPLEATTTP